MENYFDKKVALLQQVCSNREEVIRRLVSMLESVDCVTPEYFDSILERERVFPTGLQTKICGIAIPHTETNYAKHAQIAFMSLKHPVVFQSMDSSGELAVSLVFMLVLTRKNAQVKMLKKLMNLFKDKEAIQCLVESRNPEQVESILTRLNDNTF